MMLCLDGRSYFIGDQVSEKRLRIFIIKELEEKLTFLCIGYIQQNMKIYVCNPFTLEKK
jgi:hypothetical protein